MVWEKAKDKLKEELRENIFNLWIDPLQCLHTSDDSIKIACPDRFFMAYVSNNFLSSIQEQVCAVDGKERKVIFEELVQPSPSPSSREQLRLPHVPKGGATCRSLHPRYTFEEFMVGESNILAESACRSITAGNDSVGPCLYINSSTGLGKSHLTHALAHQILHQSPMTQLHYVTAQQFSLEMVQNIKTNTMDKFKRKYHDHCDILLVEDVQSLTGKKKTQMEMNELLDTLIKTGKKVVLTSNRPPRDLVGIDDDFRSRMTSGLVTSIQAPDLSTRNRIVRQKAVLHNLSLEDDLVDFVAQHIKGDVRQVESAIIAIGARAKIQNGYVDLELVREVVKSVVGIPKILTPAVISEFVGKEFQVSMQDMQSKSRKKALAFPRQVAMYLCRKHTQESLAEIGKQFKRDHSTVLHSIKVVNTLTARNISVQEQLKLLSNKIIKL